jgi:hypothetical protein
MQLWVMVAEHLSEMLVTTYKTTQHHNHGVTVNVFSAVTISKLTKPNLLRTQVTMITLVIKSMGELMTHHDSHATKIE